MDNRIGFDKRLIALILDGVLFCVGVAIIGPIIGGILGFFFGGTIGGVTGGTIFEELVGSQAISTGAGIGGLVGGATGFILGIVAGAIVVGNIYQLLELFAAATLGKILVGITVASENGSAATQNQLLIRYGVKNIVLLSGSISAIFASGTLSVVGKIIGAAGAFGGVLVFFGYLLVLGSKKQGLHDKIAKTAVYPRETVSNLGLNIKTILIQCSVAATCILLVGIISLSLLVNKIKKETGPLVSKTKTLIIETKARLIEAAKEKRPNNSIFVSRKWTDSKGRTITGTFIKFERDSVHLKSKKSGKIYKVRLNILSDADQQLVENHLANLELDIWEENNEMDENEVNLVSKRVPSGKKYLIDRSQIDSSAWTKVMTQAKNNRPSIKQAGVRRLLTLMRVILEKGKKGEKVQFTSTKLLNPEAIGGGGIYSEVKNGDFVLVEHINSAKRKNGKDPVTIGSYRHHHLKIWVEVPSPGEVNLLGDVIIGRIPEDEMGRLEVKVTSTQAQNFSINKFLIGPVVVGGPYGSQFPIVSNKKSTIGRFAPGTYKILLPEINMIKSRWTITVSSGKTTVLNFLAHSQQHVEKTDESYIDLKD